MELAGVSHRIRVGLIFGGRSGEHEVSLASAQSVARAIDRDKYDVELIGITKAGSWTIGPSALKELLAISPTPLLRAGDLNGRSNGNSETVMSRDLVQGTTSPLRESSPLGTIDVAFPLVHGTYGEDGTIQGLLEMADIPYVGAGVAASAIGMDKSLMKTVFQAHGLPQVDWVVITRREWERRPGVEAERIEAVFGYPCFVKPANLGSSVGITKAHDRAELEGGLATAAQYDGKIVVERAAPNVREIECSVLGNDEPIASMPGEVVTAREFYDYAAKYSEDSGTKLIVPADLSPEVTHSVRDLAIRAFKAIDGNGMARVDFFVEREGGRILLNEINTIPGFTSVSMYPRMWEKSGITFCELIDRLIQLALERHTDRRRSRTEFI